MRRNTWLACALVLACAGTPEADPGSALVFGSVRLVPKAGAEPLPSEDTKPLILSVDVRGNLYLNLGKDEDSPVTEDVVLERVGAVLRREPKTPVLVKADQTVPYGRVVTGMVLLQQAGAEKVGFITDPAELKRRPQR